MCVREVGDLSKYEGLNFDVHDCFLFRFLTPLLLQYDSTAEHSSASGPQIGNSIQIAKNMHAMLAVRALARLAGLLDDDLYTPHNEIAAKALREMLTPKIAAMLSNESPRDLLRNLNSNVESPQVCGFHSSFV